MVDKPITTKEKKEQKKDYIFAVGRRKQAVARVRLYENLKPDAAWNQLAIKKGEFLVNEMLISEYFPGEVCVRKYTEPLRIVNALNKYAFTIQVAGGGPAGQLDAVVAGISRALNKLDPETNRLLLKKKGFLTRDARIRERRKVGTGGKARRKKQSPKR